MSGTVVFNERKRKHNLLIRELLTVVLLLAYALLLLYCLRESDWGPLALVRQNLFLTFCLNMGGMLCCLLYIEQRMDLFLRGDPVLENPESMEQLKQVLRTEMYLTIPAFLMTGNAIGTGIGILAYYDLLKGGLVLVIWFFSMPLLSWCSHTQKKIYQIECKNRNLEPELELLIKNWSTRIFPNF